MTQEKHLLCKLNRGGVSCDVDLYNSIKLILACLRLSVSEDGSESSAERATSGVVPRCFPIRPQ